VSEQRPCEVRDLGRLGYAEAFELQRELVEKRKRGLIPDQLLFVEHPHVITMGRNGHANNVLASPEILERAGIQFHETDRGGDVTYHGPGQLVGYPIFDLRDWKRDVVAFVRGIEQAIIDALAPFGIAGSRDASATGVWVENRRSSGDGQALPPAKICAIGVHLSRWVSSHGFALNIETDLNYFRYIVPCGLTKPVTSMRLEGSTASRAEVQTAVIAAFRKVFDLSPVMPHPASPEPARIRELKSIA
jgi:lipoyl(octanoyl) transferase